MQDHPRIRGENASCWAFFLFHIGSPPHTRGKFLSFSFCFPYGRITPAYAGKIAFPCPAAGGGTDHPRIRGENSWISSKIPRCTGSPPHTRGKFPHLRGRLIGDRITPAYAGKIMACWIFSAFSWDHPRIRGENALNLSPVDTKLGSPPHTRGKCNSSVARNITIGITPAYAGKISRKAIVLSGM